MDLSNLIKLPTHNPQHYQWVRPGDVADVLVMREIWCENVYEVEAKDIQGSKVVVDIGAHTGTFSIFASQFDPEIQVYAFEPENTNRHILIKNLEENGLLERVHVRPVAVGDDNRDAHITNNSGGSTILDATDSDQVTEIVTLELALSGIDKVDVLKIDVEGFEHAIIMGAPKEVLAKCQYITIEMDSRNHNWGDMVEKLSETHHVRTMGAMSRGGMLFARSY